MDMTFWGVRGGLPVAGVETLRYGGNTACIALTFPGGEYFIFDAGTGIKVLGDHLERTAEGPIRARIFISHPHWDHINSLPFFRHLYKPDSEIEIYGPIQDDMSIRDLISAQMEPVVFPVNIEVFGPKVSFSSLDEQSIKFGDIIVTTMQLSHKGISLGYRVDYGGKSFCYIIDNEMFLDEKMYGLPDYMEKLTAFIAGADALVADATYTDDEYASRVGWGHSCLSQVAKLAHRARVKTLYLFHHDPGQTDADIDKKLNAVEACLRQEGSKTRAAAPAEGQTFTV